MPGAPSLLDELRTQYEAARTSPHQHSDVEGFEEINKRMRGVFAYLEKVVNYLDGLKPPIEHHFDLGHGLVFEAPKFGRGYVGQHTMRIVGFPVLDEISIWYEITALRPLTIEIAQGGAAMAEKCLDDAGLHYTSRRIEDRGGVLHKSVLTVPPAIPAAVTFHVDYQTGLVVVSLVNVDRFDRVSLEFHSQAIDESVLEDLVRFILGKNSAFLSRAPLAGIHGITRA